VNANEDRSDLGVLDPTNDVLIVLGQGMSMDEQLPFAAVEAFQSTMEIGAVLDASELLLTRSLSHDVRVGIFVERIPDLIDERNSRPTPGDLAKLRSHVIQVKTSVQKKILWR